MRHLQGGVRSRQVQAHRARVVPAPREPPTPPHLCSSTQAGRPQNSPGGKGRVNQTNLQPRTSYKQTNKPKFNKAGFLCDAPPMSTLGHHLVEPVRQQ